MATRNSQNVRLKDEVITPLAEYCRPRGSTQQHVASVGAWFYMCLPEPLSTQIGIAFYEWCKDRSPHARIPKALSPLLERVVNLINDECAKENQRISREEDQEDEIWNGLIMSGQNPESIKQAAGEALGRAVGKLRKPSKKRKSPATDKGQQTP